MKKSKKVVGLIMVGISVLLIWFIKYNFDQVSVETTLIKSFNNSGAEVISTEIYFTGELPSNGKDFEEKKLFAEDLAKQLGIIKNDSYLCRQITNDSIQKIEVSGSTLENKSVDINLELDKIVNGNKNIITVSITQFKSIVGIEDTKKNVVDLLKKNKINPKVNSSITGRLPGKFDTTQLDEICDRILKGADAETITTTKDRNLISVSAYSHSLGTTLTVSGKRMNLNLAIRYNSLEDKTYIWLATPVITTEY